MLMELGLCPASEAIISQIYHSLLESKATVKKVVGRRNEKVGISA